MRVSVQRECDEDRMERSRCQNRLEIAVEFVAAAPVDVRAAVAAWEAAARALGWQGIGTGAESLVQMPLGEVAIIPSCGPGSWVVCPEHVKAAEEADGGADGNT